MIELPPTFLAHLAQSAQSLTICWRVTKRNGEVIRGTACDRDVVITTGPRAGTYGRQTAIFSTDVQHRSDGRADNVDVEGAFRVDGLVPSLTPQEIEAGLYDNAEAELFVVNWQAPDDGQKALVYGTLGEFTRDSEGRFRSEVRGLANKLMQQIVKTYSQRCHWSFGSTECGFDVAAVTRTGVVTAVASRKRFTATLSPAPAPPELPANMSFEDGNTGWTFSGDGNGAIVQAAPTFDGSWKVTANDTGGNNQRVMVSDSRIPVEAGKVVTLRAHVFCWGHPDRTRCQIRINWYDSGGTHISTSTMAADNTIIGDGYVKVLPGLGNSGGLVGLAADNEWTQIEVVAKAPANAASWAPAMAFNWGPDGAWYADAFSMPATGLAASPAYYNGGRLFFTSGANDTFLREVRVATVDQNEVAQILLWDEAPDDIEVGATFTLEPGCDKTYQTCRFVHDNLINFGGWGLFAVGKDALMRGPADAVTRAPGALTQEQKERLASEMLQLLALL